MIKRILILLAALGLLAVLLIPQRADQEDRSQTAEKQAAEQAYREQAEQLELMQREKRRVEAQLDELKQIREQEKNALMNAMVLFSTPEDEQMEEAFALMDRWELTGLLGVSDVMLEEWSRTGVPEMIRERLDAGWEVCFVLEETPVGQMKRLAQDLTLPDVSACYTKKNSTDCSAQALVGSGIRVLMADDITDCRRSEGLWYVPSIGNMSDNVYSVYQSRRRSSETMAFVVGHLSEDQRYDQPNFEAMLETFSEDSLSVTAQHIYALAARTEDQSVMADWEQRHKELQMQWNGIMQQIGNLRQQMAAAESAAAE